MKKFKWGEIPPKWFMNEMAIALQMMARNGEAIHAWDTGSHTFLIAHCPIYKANELAARFGRAYQETFPDDNAKFIQSERFRTMEAEDIGAVR